MAMTAVATLMMIGAMDRLEGFDDLRHLGSQPSEHRLDDVIALDQDPRFLDLRGKMPVAEMPAELHPVNGIAGTDFQQGFLGGDDLDMAAAFELEKIAMFQHDRLPEVEHHHIVMRQMKEFAPQMALVMPQHDDIDRYGLDSPGFDDAGGTVGHGILCFAAIMLASLRRRNAKKRAVQSPWGKYRR